MKTVIEDLVHARYIGDIITEWAQNQQKHGGNFGTVRVSILGLHLRGLLYIIKNTEKYRDIFGVLRREQ